MSEPSTITVCSDKERAQWDAFVVAHPQSGPYHQFAWMKAVHGAYGYAPMPLGLWRGGELAAVLPVVMHSVPLRGSVFISLPFCDYGGILAYTAEDEKALREYITAAGREQSKQVELRIAEAAAQSGEEDAEDETVPHKVLMRLALPDSSDALWKGFRSKLRSQVQRPLKGGLSTVNGGAELLSEFYQVYAHNMRDLGSPPHSRRWFQAVLDEYGKQARIFLIKDEATVVASSILLMHAQTGTVPWASTLRSWNKLSPNMLLYWEMLKFSTEAGCRTFDFGRSTPGEGTYRFKAQWGAQPQPLAWEQLVSESESAQDTAKSGPSPARAFVAGCWQKLPVPVSTVLGSALRRYISL